MPWMNGSHGEKTLRQMKTDKKKGFKGASEMPKNHGKLRVWQKVFQRKTCDPLDPCHRQASSNPRPPAGRFEPSWRTL